MALQHLRSSTANKRPIPTQLSAGQIAVNTNEASPGLFFKDSNGDLVKIGPVHVGTSAPNSSPASTAATALVSGTVYQILTVGTTDFTAIGASANTVGTVFTATGAGTGTGTVSGQQGNEKGEQWLDTTGGAYDLKIYDGSAWRSQAGEFVNVTGDNMTGNLTLGTNKVVLNASSGAGTFAGAVTSNSSIQSGEYAAGAAGSIQIFNNTASAQAFKVGNTTNGSNIAMKSDGSATFASNVGIGTTSPLANLQVGGYSSSQGISIAAGTSSYSYLYFADGSSGSQQYRGYMQYNHATDSLEVGTTGSERLRIDSSGRVGIGLSNPSQKLHIQDSSGPLLTFDDATTQFGHVGSYNKLVGSGNVDTFLVSSANSKPLVLRAPTGQTISFDIASNNAMRIDSSGNVAIGTTAVGSSAKLEVRSTTGAINSATLRVNGGLTTSGAANTGSTLLFAGHIGTGERDFASVFAGKENGTSGNNDAYLAFGTRSGSAAVAERMRIDSSGNVGIGTNSPSTKLHIASNGSGGDVHVTNGSGQNALLELAGNGNTIGSGSALFGQAADNTVYAGVARGAHPVILGTSNTERMRINSAGNVGIGASSINNKLVIAASSNNPSYFQSVNGSTGTSGNDGVVMGMGDANNAYFWNFENGSMVFATSSTERMRITSGGEYEFRNASTTVLKSVDTSGSSATDYGQFQFKGIRGADNDSHTYMTIDSSGRVGIGTTAPKRQLHINGGNETVKIQLTNTTTGSANDGEGFQIGIAANGDAFLEQRENLPLIFYTNNTERLRIDSSGRLGLGTSSPSSLLHVSGQDTTVNISAADGSLSAMTDNTSQRIAFQGGNTEIGLFKDSSGNYSYVIGTYQGSIDIPLVFRTGNRAERMRIDSSGNVGIGTTSPARPLSVSSSQISARFLSSSSDSQIEVVDSSGTVVYGSASGNAIVQAGGNERMRIDSSGRLLINHTADTAPAGYASKLQLCDTSYQGSSLLIRRDQNNDSAPALLFTKTRSSTKGGNTIVQNGDLTGQIMFFAGDGNDANGQTAYIASAVDGTPGSNDIPGRLTFHTTADGATASTERMRIDSSGRLLLGTITEGYSDADDFTIASSGNTGITIRSGTTNAGAIYFSDGTSGNAEYRGYIEYSQNSDFLRFGTAAAERMRITSSGNFGIGTSSPSSYANFTNFTLKGGTSGSNLDFFNSSGVRKQAIVANASNGLSIECMDAGAINFNTNNLERMRLDSSGRLGLGTSNPQAPFVISNSGAQGIEAGYSSGTSTNFIQAYNRSSSAFIELDVIGNPLVFKTGTSATERMGIASNGNTSVQNASFFHPATNNTIALGTSSLRWSVVYANNGTIQTSDERLKTEIATSALATDFVKSLRPVSYKWIEGGKRHTGEYDEDNNFVYETVAGARTHWGFIAQEVKQSADDAGVDFGGWVLEDKDDADSTQSLRYDQFIAPLTKALQEAIAKIETLEAKVAALEAG